MNMPVALEAIPEVSRTLVVVLGMHRSGTSCLTGMLQEAGVYLGDVHTKNPHNARGNREHPEVMRINDALLHSVDARWDSPPVTDPAGWPSHLEDTCMQFIGNHLRSSAYDMVGIKDPRLLFTMSAWKFDQLPVGIRFVATIRHPVAVARSLNARNRIPISAGLELWRAYNCQLLELVRHTHCPVINFDAPPEQYRQRFGNIVEQLGLARSHIVGSEPFYDATLRHHVVTETAELPDHVAPLYRELLALSSC